jgi:hypothetical protein
LNRESSSVDDGTAGFFKLKPKLVGVTPLALESGLILLRKGFPKFKAVLDPLLF